MSILKTTMLISTLTVLFLLVMIFNDEFASLEQPEDQDMAHDAVATLVPAVPASVSAVAHQSEQIAVKTAAKVLWREVSDVSMVTDELPSIAPVPGKGLVNLDITATLSLQPGDITSLKLGMLSGNPDLWVQSAKRLSSGSYSITGMVDGDPTQSFSMTIGTKEIFGTFGTQDGIFSLKGNHQYVWVFPVEPLRRAIAPDSIDYRTRSDRDDE